MSVLTANRKQRILVTGAAGFLGRHLIVALLDEGWEVLAMVHKRRLPERLRTDAVQVMQGDANDLTTIRDAILRADAVCHLAACIPPDHEDSAYAERCLQVNGLLTLRTAEFALEGRKRLLFFSLATYRYSRALVSENAPLYPSERATYYLASKLVGELYVEHLRHLYQLPAITLRVASCYGPGMPERSVVRRFMNCAWRGLPLQVWDDGIPTYDFVYASDVVKLAVAALKSGDPGIYNVGSGRAHSVLDLARAVADTFPERDLHIDVRPPLGSIPASFPALSIAKAVKMWDYRPLSLREGLAEYRKQMGEESSDYSDTE
jgi:UDP-glucose 4-epimerase